MEEGLHDIIRHWQLPNSTCAKTHPNFELDNNYINSWNKNVFENVEFYYCIVEL